MVWCLKILLDNPSKEPPIVVNIKLNAIWLSYFIQLQPAKILGNLEAYSIVIGAWTEKDYFPFNIRLGGEVLQTASFIAVHPVMNKCFNE